ncbi:SDR family oxidoreductase [Kingella negevensis]|uniref:SDR family oxidoreductase n=1 Tax=Kingella negevensis TaxID=1522312 RepID=UPI00050A1612|nr:SDR family oxidoreductase [Kingella negevensis]MDK4680214.1 SDR family oxidoreductase [Kingella negevensis]MDK4682066.1 SDR family oxidoreductase [Kingella negevensis]MDK4688579.1 SDR family oxidoreductase [Kingella negevensis]MDK4690262.1 SDR family oxidoreductase [Kingella negevensis]MDK4692392.1 SDR family oxidoreductase [Kingella negevensis]
MTEQSLKNKTILITGASQGLGAETAKACAAAGATVILMARSQKKLEKVYDDIVAAGSPEPFAMCFDMIHAEEKEFDYLAQTIAEATQGKLDGVIHCASYFYALSPLDFQTVNEWVNQYRINTVAPMALTRAVLPMLKESEDASVIFVGESHGETPQAYWGGFGASKAALNYLCKVVADEWERFPNLRANVLVPGSINSPQRIKTHPGESASERKNMTDITPDFVWWASEASRGRSGEIVYL